MALPGAGIDSALVLSYLKNKRIIAVLTGFVALVLLLSLKSFPYVPSFSNIRQTTSAYHISPTRPLNPASSFSNTGEFWPQFYAALLAGTPRCALPHHGIEAGIGRYTPGPNPPRRQDLITLDSADEEELTTAHSWFVSQITSASFPHPPFITGSSGVVTSAGGEFLPEALVAIRMLRRTGSTLPIDVIFATRDEVEGSICEHVLPAMGARCIVLSEMINDLQGGLPHRMNLSRYQIKAFALLLSSFDNSLWIDADQIPLVDPAQLLTSDPLHSKGLVTWPDYWYSTSSPLFFRVANISSNLIPPINERPASETGQLLVSKSSGDHYLTLLLVAYYNFHGPTHYYKLLSQGAMGEGDKETFLAAAMAMNQDYWHIRTDVDTIGYRDGAGEYQSTGILQAHPGLDFAKYKDQGPGTPVNFDVNRVAPAFLHSEQHKPNAGRYSRLWRNNIRARMWPPEEEKIARLGRDFERESWDEIVWTACGKDLGGHVFNDWIGNPQFVDEEGTVDQQGRKWGSVCEQSKEVYQEMFGESWEDFGRLGEEKWSSRARWESSV